MSPSSAGRARRARRGVVAVSAPILAAVLAAAGCQAIGRGEPYVPGLGEIMSLTQMRHLKLWFAGEGGNWELAAYETDELAEGFADVVRLHPVHGEPPIALSELVPELTARPLAALRAAIGQRDRARFESAFDALTEACNACHRSAGFSFNRIARPTENPYSNQRFRLP